MSARPWDRWWGLILRVLLGLLWEQPCPLENRHFLVELATEWLPQGPRFYLPLLVPTSVRGKETLPSILRSLRLLSCCCWWSGHNPLEPSVQGSLSRVAFPPEGVILVWSNKHCCASERSYFRLEQEKDKWGGACPSIHFGVAGSLWLWGHPAEKGKHKG